MKKKYNFLNIIKHNNFSDILSDEFENINKNDLLKSINILSNFFINKKVIFFPENNVKSISILISLITSCSKVFILNEETYKEDLNNIVKKFKPDFIISSVDIIKFLKKKKKIKILNHKLFTYDGKIKRNFCFEEILLLKKPKTKIINNNTEIICSTSGTTGKSKKIHFYRDKFILRALKSNNLYKIKKGKFLISTPFHHSVALKCLFMAIMSKNKIFLLNNFTTYKCKKILSKNTDMIWHSSSSQIKEMIVTSDRYFLRNKNIQCIISCADSLEEKFKKKIQKFKLKFFDTYGCTETDGITNVLIKKNMKKFNTVGKANPTHLVKILNKRNLKCKTHEIGEINVKTNLICDKINNIKQKIKYYKTGDLGYFDFNKNLFITGRKKNLIISSGINIYPERIENILKKNNKIRNAIIIANKSVTKGEYLIALIIKKKKLDEYQVYDYLIDKLPNYCIPKKVKFIKKIPLNNLGKIDRNSIKDNFKFT